MSFRAASNLNFTNPRIVTQTNDYIDVEYTATEGYMHWVIYRDLPGAYQYFVNKALPRLGEFRTLWRLNNETFLSGKTRIKDGILPPYAEYLNATNVQDETWQKADGSYLTKYDWADFLRGQKTFGVYGPEYGSWYIYPNEEFFNGDQLKQELLVHRESVTGDVVQLNMIHGTHFQASAVDDFKVGKIWGPWLWYLNDGSYADAEARYVQETAAWPYEFLKDDAYHSRGEISGRLILSDGRPASNAAIFLGDNHPNKTTLDQGSDYYYTTYADEDGSFKIPSVRSAQYALQAFSAGSPIGNVSSTFIQNDITITPNATTDLGPLSWQIQPRSGNIFQIGDFDRRATGFQYAESPRQHGLVAKCPANLTYTVGTSETKDWCFGQTWLGTWTVRFHLDQMPPSPDANTIANISPPVAILTTSFASYSTPTALLVTVQNNHTLTSPPFTNANGTLSFLSDQGLYRSGTSAGEHHYVEFPVEAGVLKEGWNTVEFTVTRASQWRGFMWDAVALDWA